MLSQSIGKIKMFTGISFSSSFRMSLLCKSFFKKLFLVSTVVPVRHRPQFPSICTVLEYFLHALQVTHYRAEQSSVLYNLESNLEHNAFLSTQIFVTVFVCSFRTGGTGMWIRIKKVLCYSRTVLSDYLLTKVRLLLTNITMFCCSFKFRL